jgi:hypothetical protein
MCLTSRRSQACPQEINWSPPDSIGYEGQQPGSSSRRNWPHNDESKQVESHDVDLGPDDNVAMAEAIIPIHSLV